jgi:hypothetical protein
MKVILMSFRQVTRQNGRLVVHGSPVVEIELLGETHTLQDAAECLFEYYLRDVLGEELYMHIWRFEPIDDTDLALNKDTPILSDNMIAKEPYDLGLAPPQRRTLDEGTEMIFMYDEGSPTRLAVKIERIIDKPDDEEDDYPRKRISKAVTSAITAEGVVTVDQAFPELAAAVLSKRYPASYFGRCAKELHVVIEGGPKDNGDQLFAPVPFESFEDCLICCNKAWPTFQKEYTENNIRKGWVNLVVAPPHRQSDATEVKLERSRVLFGRISRFLKESGGDLTYKYPGDDRPTRQEQYMMLGPKDVYCRMTLEELAAEKAALREKGFDLAAMFPTICSMLSSSSSSNVWFKIYQQQVMVAAGMTSGELTDKIVQSLCDTSESEPILSALLLLLNCQ